MSRSVPAITGRLSLRAPQRKALEIFARVTHLLGLPNRGDAINTLAVIRKEYPEFVDFERQFPNLCFSLATGVGKTRLMGAFIAHLYLDYGVRHFCVLAPNLTIYEKLLRDFTPNSDKYVLRGIAEFAVRPPLVITGDNWEVGAAIKSDARHGQQSLFELPAHINLFNIAKMLGQPDSEQTRRLRSVREVFGQSYFDYLAGLDDLVVFMDEAHRYRADRSMETIDALRPMLGVELTATPIAGVGHKTRRFKNVIYDYPLAAAMSDGLVKEPAVVSREDLTPAQAKAMGEDRLERMKLEDGMRLHENTKAALEAYAINEGRLRVKPFVLVIAQDTSHATALKEFLASDEFCGGRYRQRVIEVHSAKTGAEKDENVALLLSVEKEDNPIEIVIHVNMLKEGWDVTNLYTIIPLRAANSKVLVEQSVGRGLRLPYGQRTGEPAVDRLAIVAHDHFQEIVEEAKKGGFAFSEVKLSPEKGNSGLSTVVVPSRLGRVLGEVAKIDAVLHPSDGETWATCTKSPFESDSDRAIAQGTLEVIQRHGSAICHELGKPSLPKSLQDPAAQARIVTRVNELMVTQQLRLPALDSAADVASVVQKATALFATHAIMVPRVSVVPLPTSGTEYIEFSLDFKGKRYQPVAGELIIQSLSTEERTRINAAYTNDATQPLEDYVVRGLIEFPDVSYGEQAGVLYALAGQVLAYLRSYLPDEDAVRNVLVFHQRVICDDVHEQMLAHAQQSERGYSVVVTSGSSETKPVAFTVAAGESIRDFRLAVDDKQRIREMLFGGFKKSLYEVVRFQSDAERLLSVVLESSQEVVKWTKPAKGAFQIAYGNDHDYEPDFVVETDAEKLIVETKRADQIADSVVQAKANAAVVWCQQASDYERSIGGKPWRYLLVPHDAVGATTTLRGLAQGYTRVR
jgi:type III restriction enzyme